MERIENTVRLILSNIIGKIVGMLGETTPSLRLLKFLVVTDFLTGITKGFIERNICSNKIFIGGYRKALIFLVIIICNQFDTVFTDFYLRETAIVYYIINEGVSIFENISVYIPVPQEISKFFSEIGGSEDENK